MSDSSFNNLKVVALATLFTIFIWRDCSKRFHGAKNTADTISVSSKKVFDTTTYSTVLPTTKPISETYRYPVKSTEGTKDEQPYKLDTLAIVRAYFTARYYKRNYADTNISIELSDTVFNNEITWSKIDYRLLRPLAILNTTVLEKKVEARNKLFAGFGLNAGFDRGIYPAFGPEILLINKRENAYRIGYMYNGSSLITAGMYWKITLRKK